MNDTISKEGQNQYPDSLEYFENFFKDTDASKREFINQFAPYDHIFAKKARELKIRSMLQGAHIARKLIADFFHRAEKLVLCFRHDMHFGNLMGPQMALLSNSAAQTQQEDLRNTLASAGLPAVISEWQTHGGKTLIAITKADNAPDNVKLTGSEGYSIKETSGPDEDGNIILSITPALPEESTIELETDEDGILLKLVIKE